MSETRFLELPVGFEIFKIDRNAERCSKYFKNFEYEDFSVETAGT